MYKFEEESGAPLISKSGVVVNPRRMDLSKIDDRFGDKEDLAKVAKGGAHRGRRAPIRGGGSILLRPVDWCASWHHLGLELVFIDFHTLRDLH